jgi:glycosyltransferase involved in cell wall biosynthesis
VRVAITFGTFPPDQNGGADFIARLADALCGTSVEPHILTSATHAPEREVLSSGVVVHRVIGDWSLSSAGRRSLAAVDRLVQAEQIDVVHVFFPDSVVKDGYRLPAAIGLRRLPLVTTFWSLGLGRLSPLWVKMEAAALLARSSVLSSHDPEYLRALRLVGYGRPVQMLPVGTNVDARATEAPATTRRRYGLNGASTLGFFGHLDPMRGVEDLFTALALLRRSTDVRLLMIGAAGSPEYSAYRRVPERLGIADAVVWTDFLDTAGVANALASVDLCVLPYRRASLGRSAVAASLTLGVPTLVGGGPESVAPLRSGVHLAVAPRNNPDVLARRIEELLDDEEARSRLAAGALRASRLFAWPRIAASARDLYRLALAGS